MPFQSKAQAKYLFAKHPKIAKEFAENTPSMKNLPQKVTDKTKPSGIKELRNKPNLKG